MLFSIIYITATTLFLRERQRNRKRRKHWIKPWIRFRNSVGRIVQWRSQGGTWVHALPVVAGNFFQSLIGLWACRRFVTIYDFVQSNIQHVSPACGPQAPIRGPWTPLGYFRHPDPLFYLPLSKFMATRPWYRSIYVDLLNLDPEPFRMRMQWCDRDTCTKSKTSDLRTKKKTLKMRLETFSRPSRVSRLTIPGFMCFGRSTVFDWKWSFEKRHNLKEKYQF